MDVAEDNQSPRDTTREYTPRAGLYLHQEKTV